MTASSVVAAGFHISGLGGGLEEGALEVGLDLIQARFRSIHRNGPMDAGCKCETA